MKSLESLGWDATCSEQFEARTAAVDDAPHRPARVSADFGMQLELIGPEGRRRAPLAGHFLNDEQQRPVVGDWVVVRQRDGAEQVVDLLPRRTALARRAAGKPNERQVIGANLDVVFAVSALDDEFNLKRIERYLTAIREGGAKPVVVLNKADLVDDPSSHLEAVRTSAPGVDVVVTSALDGGGLDALAGHLEPATTAAFVGSSGVGKSTLVNRLAGEEIMETFDVRASDAKGRHTTTHRQLLQLPDGALVIDTPGMREFQPWEADEGLDEVFEEVERFAVDCRFRDCRHETEPGCAVREAIEAGELRQERLEQYRKLRDELDEQRDQTRRADWD